MCDGQHACLRYDRQKPTQRPDRHHLDHLYSADLVAIKQFPDLKT